MPVSGRLMYGMSVADEPLHPRPQERRERWIDLRGPWGFAYDDDNVGVDAHWCEREDVFDRTIVVPFPPESPASGVGETGFHPVLWYRRTFTLPQEDAGKRILLHFGAVDYRAHVWVNGRTVCMHEGGQTPFVADITSELTDDGEQVVVVRAEDPPTDLAMPRGKQDWRERPHDIWYDRTSGIWQPVWIEPVGTPYITFLRWMPDVGRGMLGLSAVLSHEVPAGARVRVQLRLHDTQIVDDTFLVQGIELRRDIALDLGTVTMSRGDVLWSPGRPNLIDATITVSADGTVTDEVHSYAGLRSCGTAGGRFLLNGQPYYLRMALEQGFWPETHLAAPSDEALRREVELARQLGFNGVRIHQKVEDPRFLYWCDRLGLLVWGEMANAYVFNDSSIQRVTREWLDVVKRDWSHPCIVAWVPLNESWGVPNLLDDAAQRHYVIAMYQLTKSLDPSRPCIGNDGWEHLAGDLIGIHDYSFDPEPIRTRYHSVDALQRMFHEVQPGSRFVTLDSDGVVSNLPVVLSEFGGIGFRPRPGEEWFGYGTVEDTDTFRQRYRALVEAVLDCAPLSGFCYTQLTDTMQETNGLLTEHREFKIDPEFIRSVNTGPAQAVPADIVADLRKKAGTAFGGSASTMESAPEGDEAASSP